VPSYSVHLKNIRFVRDEGWETVKSYAETSCESVLLFGKEHTEAQK